MGASTPHFALQLRDRIAALIRGPRSPMTPPASSASRRSTASRPSPCTASCVAAGSRTGSGRCPRWADGERGGGPAARADRQARYARWTMSEQLPLGATVPPEGDPSLPGPYPVGGYAAALRERLRSFARVQLIGEVANLRPPSRARVYFELRDAEGAIPCAMWRNDWDRLGEHTALLRDGAQVIVLGGCDYYAGSASASPAFSFAVTDAADRRRGRSARPDRAPAPRARRRRAAGTPAAASARAAPADDRGRLRRDGQGPRRPPRRAGAPRLGRARRVGLRTRAGPPCRTEDRRRAARARGLRRGRHHRRDEGRRVPHRPARLLRRAALPDGRDAQRAGDRLDRPPHRPHAARRRRGRQLLDPDPRGRGGGATRLCPGPRCPARLRGAGCATTPARRSCAGRGCSRPCRGRPPPTWNASAAGCIRPCASCGPRLAGASPASATACDAARPPSSAGVRARVGTASCGGPPSSTRLALALAAHDPQRTLARGYALVEDRSGWRARHERRRRACRSGASGCASPTMPSLRESNRHERGARASHLRDPRPPASRRSSDASTPGDAGLRETLELVREGRALIEFCADELDAVGGDLEELRLDELVARLEGGTGAASA